MGALSWIGLITFVGVFIAALVSSFLDILRGMKSGRLQGWTVASFLVCLTAFSLMGLLISILFQTTR